MMNNGQVKQRHTWRDEIVVAFSFLTIFPVPNVPFRPGLLGAAGRWFPLVGLSIGLLLSGSLWLFSLLFPSPIAAILTTTLWAGLTGGLHLDGLADCCDGLLAPVTPERRLEIMHDPRTGAFAVIGLVLFLLLKVTAIATLAPTWPALIVAPVWARWLLLWVARKPTVAGSRLGAEFSSALTRRTLAFALLIPLLLCVPLWRWQVGVVGFGNLAIAWSISRSAQRRLGGMTGDVYGLIVEVSELATLLIFSIRL